MKRSLGGLTLLGVMLAAGHAPAQPQLQELALTAIAGPGWRVQSQGERVAVYTQLGLLFFRYDSITNNLGLESILQIPYSVYEFKFHPAQPLLYVLDSEHHLNFVDLTNIENPLIYDLSTTVGGWNSSFDLDEHYLYVLQGFSTVATFDNSDPREPFQVASSSQFNGADIIKLDGSFLHCFGHYPEFTKYGLFDFSDPSHPQLLASDPMNWGDFLSVGGGHSIIEAGWPQELWVYEVTQNPPYLSYPSQYEDLHQPAQCTGDGGVYAEGQAGVFQRIGNSWTWTGIGDVYDFHVDIDMEMIFANNITGPLEAWEIQPPGISFQASYDYLTKHVNHLAIGDGFLAITGAESQNVLFYDCSNPTSPQLISQLMLSDTTSNLCLNEGFLYVFFRDGYATDSVAIIDVSDPYNPQLGGAKYFTLPPMMYAAGMLVHESLLFITGYDQVLAFDVSDPGDPLFVQTSSGTHYNYAWIRLVNDEYLAVDGSVGVDIFTADSNMTWISAIQPTNSYNNMLFSKGDTLLAGGNGYLDIYSLADPQDPVLLQTFELPGVDPDIYVASYDGSYLYADLRGYPSQSDNKLVVFNLPPGATSLEMLDYLEISENNGGEPVLNDGVIYCAQASCLGIYYFGEPYVAAPPPEAPNVQPSSFILHPSHPNPFNATTVASFELRVPSQAKLRVYDTAGRLVATLVDEWKPAGKHQAIFDASDLPSGIYLAWLTAAGDYWQVQKMVLLK